METYYDILGVAKNASAKDIKKAFHKLALQHHPNKGGDAEQFKKLSDAHDTLEDPVLRGEYNAKLAEAEATGGLEETLTKQGIKHMSEEDVLTNLIKAKTLDKKILERLLRRAEGLDLFHREEYEKALNVYQRKSREHSPRSHNHRSHRAHTHSHGGAGGGAVSAEDAEFLQHLNNTAETASRETRDDLEEKIREAKAKGLRGHPSYKKAKNALSKLRRRKTRKL
jgi:curved DNA-binding protein CbpA